MTVSAGSTCALHAHPEWPACLTCPSPDEPRPRLELLHTFVRDRSGGRCEWPTCAAAGEEMAHLEHRGMGGRRSADHPNNVAWLCCHHHDILDGRTGVLKVRWELNEILRLAITAGRPA